MIKVYSPKNVYDAAVERIGRLFDEFDDVVVNISGGKDSTVIFNLARDVAERKGRLPLKVLWIDQEAEWEAVVTYVRWIMNRPDVTPMWFQGPFRMSDATTTGKDAWLHCWRDGDEWMRPREPNSIHENKTGADRFHKLFDAIAKTYHPGRVAYLTGMRGEESAVRRVKMTHEARYKDITWCRVMDKRRGQYVFHPIYDWSYRDVWKAIHAGGWSYCSLYDRMYQYGIPVMQMRVSNVHHETSIHSLQFLQEVEPQTWNRLVRRVGGTHAVARVRELYFPPSELPRMFKSWREYRNYLLDKLILDPAARKEFDSQFAQYDRMFVVEEPHVDRVVMRECVSAILVNDYKCVKLAQMQFALAQYKRNHKQWDGKYRHVT